MCGIAAIITGVCITGSHLCWQTNDTLHAQERESGLLNIDELKAALNRRGPDSLDSKKVLIQLEDDQAEISRNPLCFDKMLTSRIASAVELASRQDSGAKEMKSVAQLDFIGATLQLRGSSPVSQPLVDASGNLLVFNGEIFGGVHVDDDSNDADALLHALERCCSSDSLRFQVHPCIAELGKSIPEILSSIKGPWAFIYWQEYSKTIWFGRDAFGRRSLLVHWPTPTDTQFLLSSVSPPYLAEKYAGSSSMKDELEDEMVSKVTNPTHGLCYWEELPCGIYSIELKISKENENCMKEGLVGEVRKHKWMDPLLSKIISWDRSLLDPKMEYVKCTLSQHRVLSALRRSVMRRTTINSIFETDMKQCGEMVKSPVAILFSGGLDSMILAALLDQCLNPQYIIDLLNVSFDGELAPDRVSAKLGLRELRKVAPSRRWRLVEIDATLHNLTNETKHVMSLIHPANTYMDLNIGIALWLAAGGDGWVDGHICNLQEDQHRYKYRSGARVLLVGSGADEQCAGYGRHRTKYKHGGWLALHEEMRLDMQRIWKRNLGRDDRLISDCGKEARFPFLDEEVIQSLLEIPLWDIATLDEPVGKGDKKILREVARLLCLEDAAAMPKRAIQFGSRIARESNRKNFGSNRAANQAAAGSAKIHEHTH